MGRALRGLIESPCCECPQTLLFSATLPKMVAQFARAGLREPELVRLDVDTKVSDKLKVRRRAALVAVMVAHHRRVGASRHDSSPPTPQLAFFMPRPDEKVSALLFVLRDLLPRDQQAIVFVATRHHVELLSDMLNRVRAGPRARARRVSRSGAQCRCELAWWHAVRGGAAARSAGVAVAQQIRWRRRSLDCPRRSHASPSAASLAAPRAGGRQRGADLRLDGHVRAPA